MTVPQTRIEETHLKLLSEAIRNRVADTLHRKVLDQIKREIDPIIHEAAQSLAIDMVQSLDLREYQLNLMINIDKDKK